MNTVKIALIQSALFAFFILFLVLKLAGVITSWVMVFVPLLVSGALTGAGIVLVVAGVLATRKIVNAHKRELDDWAIGGIEL